MTQVMCPDRQPPNLSNGHLSFLKKSELHVHQMSTDTNVGLGQLIQCMTLYVLQACLALAMSNLNVLLCCNLI